MKRTLFLLTLLTALLLCGGAWAESISGCAYVDANANGLCDPGEQLMTGVPASFARAISISLPVTVSMASRT